MFRARGIGTCIAATVFGLCAIPASAQGADAYVDQETGDDTFTMPACGAITRPCRTIPKGVTTAGAGDTVHVDDTAVAQSATSASSASSLGSGKSLIAEDFVGGDEGPGAEPDTIMDLGEGVGGTPAIRVTSAAGTIQGFVIRSPWTPLRLEAAATVTGNTIDDDVSFEPCQIEVLNNGNTATIGPGNTITDPAPTGPKAGICITSGAAPTIIGNTLSNLIPAIDSAAGDTTITGNTITGTGGTTSDAAIEITSGTPTLTANRIQSPGNSSVGGIAVRQTATQVGALMRRNTILGHRFGLVGSEFEGALDLNGDLIVQSANTGVSLIDNDNDGDTALSATNVTIADSAGNNISMVNGSLVLDSSIVGGTGGGILGTDCVIIFSRGPTTGSGCAGFQTAAGPGFAGAGDYHLAPGSPMIDAGNMAAPTPGILDIDGGPRATDGNGDGVARRDIGADETATLPPGANPSPATSGATSGKCRKRKAKRHSAEVAKKRRCKKRIKR